MKEMKQTRKTLYTRNVLKDSLIELMKEKPISKITIKELCENADINRTTFYAHYADQYSLLRQIEDETLSWLKEAIPDLFNITDEHETMKILVRIFQYFSENNRHLQVLMSEQGDMDFQKQLFTLIYEQCGMSPSAAASADMGAKEDYFIFVINGSVGLIRHWLKNGVNKSAQEMAAIVYGLTSGTGPLGIPA